MYQIESQNIVAEGEIRYYAEYYDEMFHTRKDVDADATKKRIRCFSGYNHCLDWRVDS